MFKKGKKKSRETAAKNENNLPMSDEISKNILNEDLDQSDGFDKDGFVDLQPEQSNAEVLGPKQSCKYVGTFAVMSGTDGHQTLNTHKERTAYMKETLRDYRYTSSGLAVLLQVSTDGIKVYSTDSKRVRMAYPLPRICFATCDPDFCMFAFMTHSPSPMGVAVHTHVFVTHRPKQVQDITAMIGKAFKLAFAASRLPEKQGQGSVKLVESPAHQGRRWAKHEAYRGHDLSGHAEAAQIRKKKPATSKQNSSSSTDGSPVLERAGIQRQKGSGTPPQRSTPQHTEIRLDDDVVPDSLAQIFRPISTDEGSTAASRTGEGDQRSTNTPPPLPPMVPHSQSSMPSAAVPSKPSQEEVPPALPPRNQSSTRPMSPEQVPPLSTQVPADSSETLDMLEGADNSQSAMPESKTKTLLGGDITSLTSDRGSDITSLTSDRGSDITSPPTSTSDRGSRVQYIGTVDEEKRPVTSHHEEYWYMPGIPREFIMEMLQASEEGSFFVRDSQSQKDCHALTVRVSTEFQPSGFGNYLITQVPEGVKLEGFSKTHPDLTSLIVYHACNADGLPCKLLLAGSNMLCEENEDDDYINIEPADPDYRLLSDFRSMMDDLK